MSKLLKSLQQTIAADRRLVILRFLEEDTDYSMSTSLMQDALAVVGHNVSRDLVDTDAAWLEEQGLLNTHDAGFVKILKLTQRGADVATGRVTVPGVKRPAPKV